MLQITSQIKGAKHEPSHDLWNFLLKPEVMAKSELVPSQDFAFLGVRFNTVDGLVYPSNEQVERLWEWIRRIRRAKRVPARIFLVLLGHLTSLAVYVPLGRLHTRPLQLHLLTLWRPQEDSLCAQIDLDDTVRDELDWWASPSHVKAGGGGVS